MNTSGSEVDSHEPARRTPKIVFVALGIVFLLAISVPCAWLYLEIKNFRDPVLPRESSTPKVQEGGGRSNDSNAFDKSRIAATVLSADQAKLALMATIEKNAELGRSMAEASIARAAFQIPSGSGSSCFRPENHSRMRSRYK